jgi:hypothetical protein
MAPPPPEVEFSLGSPVVSRRHGVCSRPSVTPTLEHNALVEMFREHPELAPHWLATLFHLDVPPHISVGVVESSLDQLIPVEFPRSLRLAGSTRSRRWSVFRSSGAGCVSPCGGLWRRWSWNGRSKTRRGFCSCGSSWIAASSRAYVRASSRARGTLLRLLARAGIMLTERESARIQACTDIATLDRWLDNVLGAKTAADVLS